MWILGGWTYDTPTTPTRKRYNDVWSSADGVHWEQHVEHAPWVPRQYHDVAVYDGRMWVMEGSDGRNRNDVWYSADGVNWYEVPDTPWAPRHAASAFVYDGGLWMVAGNNLTPDSVEAHPGRVTRQAHDQPVAGGCPQWCGRPLRAC